MMQGTDSFWNFSVSTYARPGVADACLSLQDRFGLDVNVLLYCCWFGCTRGLMAEGALGAALSFAEPWADEVVRPLRSARKWMKVAGCVGTDVSTEACMALRDKIKTAELEAEHLQQETLEGLTSIPPVASLDPRAQTVNAASNLRSYLDHCDVRLDGSSLSELARLVAAAIDGAESADVIAVVDTVFQET